MNREHIQPNLEDRLHPKLWALLQVMAGLAQERGWQLYLVGGVVRDLLLASEKCVGVASPVENLGVSQLDGRPDQTSRAPFQDTDRATLSLPDLDLVVDGGDGNDERSGVELARALHDLYPAAKLNIYGKFQTAALEWNRDPQLGCLSIDIATARTESYAYPAANPDVIASSIAKDLYRRDFTINALTIRLTQPHGGELFDLYGGLADLEAKQMRVLHADSFIDDPTRIYRGVRFAIRLGFTIESQTQVYIRSAIASGIYERTLAEYPKVPALQTRLKAELKNILQTSYWLPILAKLNELDALKCLHPHLKLDDELSRRLEFTDRAITSGRLVANDAVNLPRLSSWLIRLEILLTGLNLADRVQVIHQLQLPDETFDRLTTLDRSHQELNTALASTLSISQTVRLLQPYDRILLLLIAIVAAPKISAILHQYLTTWIHIKPPINGRDLKALGYKPGAQYHQILDTLLFATLDNIITDRDSAIAFINKHQIDLLQN
jgi:tRNA nucleotidyltransferase (CCA-adding enzyme)